MQLVLSIFPGIDMLGRAFEESGPFCVVRGPDAIFGGDIRGWHVSAGRFDGVIGGPPCQAFSRLAHMVRHNGYEPKFGNLIPEFERVVIEAEPEWWLMENVPDAPDPVIPGYGVHCFLLNNRQCIDEDGKPATQNRMRKWWFGNRGERRVLMIETAVFQNPVFEYAAVHGGGVSNRLGCNKGKCEANLGSRSGIKAFQHFRRIQGLPNDFDLPSFTVAGKCAAVVAGVPMPMGRAIAKAVLEVTSP